jgi:dihydroanticapsin dehydrogenase
MRGLKGRVAVVTGGLGDLGYACGQRLAEEGCHVALLDVRPDAEAAAERVGCRFIQADLTQEASIAAALDQVAREIGGATILVNCAARFIFKGIDATAEDWARITQVNIAGTSLVTKHTVPQMIAAGGGSVINFSSVSGFVGQANFATYNATKFAIRGLTKCWAQDLAQHRIRVNTVCPGYIYTSAFIKSCKDLGLDEQAEDRRASDMHLLGRQGRPEEVAAATAFLASDDASFMTGSDLIVDGGYLAK